MWQRDLQNSYNSKIKQPSNGGANDREGWHSQKKRCEWQVSTRKGAGIISYGEMQIKNATWPLQWLKQKRQPHTYWGCNATGTLIHCGMWNDKALENCLVFSYTHTPYNLAIILLLGSDSTKMKICMYKRFIPGYSL